MNALERLAYLAATEPAFRQALAADPQAALASQGLALNANEMAAISNLRHLLATPPQALATRLFSAYEPINWGGMPPVLASGR